MAANPMAEARIVDVTARELALASEAIRSWFNKRRFFEVALSPLDAYVTTHPNAWPPLEGRQPRFNTEPEIWRWWDGAQSIYSISPLFRVENKYNIFHRPSFLIVDFYTGGTVPDLIIEFQNLLVYLGSQGLISRLHLLEFTRSAYDTRAGVPNTLDMTPRMVIADGYTSVDSFFEVDVAGRSTRNEIFLVCALGALELGALGIAGRNENPLYEFAGGSRPSEPPEGLVGMGFGLERLLLADRALEGAVANG
jgi:hypothetical protein